MNDNVYNTAGLANTIGGLADSITNAPNAFATNTPYGGFGIFSAPADPNAPGLFASQGTGYGLMSLGSNMINAANQRISGGFLANPGFLGALGAGLSATMNQSQKDVANRAYVNQANVKTLGEQIDALTKAANLKMLQWRLQHPPPGYGTGDGTTTTGDAGTGDGTSTAASGPGPVPDKMDVDPDYATALKAGESSNVAKAENKVTHALGFYQMTAPALYSEGMYQPAQGETLDARNNTWQGKIVVPGYQPMTKDEFLNNPAAQEEVFSRHMSYLRTQAQQLGLSKYIGQTLPDGTVVTPEVIASLMHFAGPQGAKRYLDAKGGNDANGKPTDVSDGNLTMTQYAARINRGYTTARQTRKGGTQTAGPGAPTSEPAPTNDSANQPEPQPPPNQETQPAPTEEDVAQQAAGQRTRERQGYDVAAPNPGQQAAKTLPVAPRLQAPSQMQTYDVPMSQPGALSSGQGNPEATVAQNTPVPHPQLGPDMSHPMTNRPVGATIGDWLHGRTATAPTVAPPTTDATGTPQPSPSVVQPPVTAEQPTAPIEQPGATTAARIARTSNTAQAEANADIIRQAMIMRAAGAQGGGTPGSDGGTQVADASGTTVSTAQPAQSGGGKSWFDITPQTAQSAPAPASSSGPSPAQASAQGIVQNYVQDRMGEYRSLMRRADQIQAQQNWEKSVYGQTFTPGSPEAMRDQAKVALENAQKPPITTDRNGVSWLNGRPLVDLQTQRMQDEHMKAQTNFMEHDNTTTEKMAHEVETARASQAAALRLGSILQQPGMSTGATTAAKTEFMNYLRAVAPGLAGRLEPLIANNQEFAKQALQLTTEQMEETTGTHGRGGIQMMTMIQKANPQLDLVTLANKHLINYTLVMRQLGLDHDQGAIDYHNKAMDAWADNISGRQNMSVEEQQKARWPTYDKLSNFEGKFNAAYRPVLYNAAVLAMDGAHYADWSKGLSPSDQQRIIGIVQRANPYATVELQDTAGNVRTVPAQAVRSVIHPTRDITVMNGNQ